MPYKLTLVPQNEHVLVLQEANRHILTSETPITNIDYDALINKPKINHVELQGDLSFEDLGFSPLSQHDIYIITGLVSTEDDFDEVLNNSEYLELNNNMTLTEQKHITHNISIYLNDFNIQSDIDVPLFLIDGITVTVIGSGEITATHGVAWIINGGKLIINDHEYTEELPVITNAPAYSE